MLCLLLSSAIVSERLFRIFWYLGVLITTILIVFLISVSFPSYSPYANFLITSLKCFSLPARIRLKILMEMVACDFPLLFFEEEIIDFSSTRITPSRMPKCSERTFLAWSLKSAEEAFQAFTALRRCLLVSLTSPSTISAASGSSSHFLMTFGRRSAKYFSRFTSQARSQSASHLSSCSCAPLLGASSCLLSLLPWLLGPSP